MGPTAAQADCGQRWPRSAAGRLRPLDASALLATLPRTLSGLLDWRVARTPHRPAYYLRRPSSGTTLSWDQAAAVIEEVAAGLLLFGLPPHAVVAVASSARTEAALVEWAIARAAGVGVGLHPGASSREVRDVLAQSGASILIAEDANQLAAVREHWSRLSRLQAVVVLDADAVGPGSVHAGDQRVLSLDALRARGRAALGVDPELVRDVVAWIEPDDVAALVDTAGPEGPAQLVPVTHDACTRQAAAVAATGRLDECDLTLLCLPMSHPLGRTWRAVQLVAGFPIAVADDLDELVQSLPVVRPRVVVALTQTVQRGQAQARLRLSGDRRPPTRIARWALGEADDDRSPQQVVAGALVLPRLRAGLGGRLRYVVCGSAGLDPAVSTWFARLGVKVLDGVSCVGDNGGSAPDERLPEQDRLPADWVQARFAAVCPYVGHLVRFGSHGARVALVSLDGDAMATWSQQHGMAGERYQQVVASEPVRAMVQRYLDRLNTDLPAPERIRGFMVLPVELTVADGSLSWDLQVRRKTLASRHSEALADLGAG